MNCKNKYFQYAEINIQCDCQECFCPNSKKDKGLYSFTYIKEDKKIMYFNTPKAASSSIRSNIFDNNNELSLIVPKYDEANYFKFTFVRNPWDRLISNWKMFTEHNFRKKQLESMTGRSDYSLAEFIKVIENFDNHHWLNQSIYIPKKIDFIGKVEFFEPDIISVLKQTNIPYNPKIWNSKLNSTKRINNYKFYYNNNSKLINKVAQLYKEDILRFNYTF